jgi:hypothetical protein
MAFDRTATDEAIEAQGGTLEELHSRIRDYLFRKDTATAQAASNLFGYMVERVAGMRDAVVGLDLL